MDYPHINSNIRQPKCFFNVTATCTTSSYLRLISSKMSTQIKREAAKRSEPSHFLGEDLYIQNKYIQNQCTFFAALQIWSYPSRCKYFPESCKNFCLIFVNKNRLTSCKASMVLSPVGRCSSNAITIQLAEREKKLGQN